MADEISADLIQQVNGFVSLLKSKPELLHDDRLGPFRDYLKSLGAKIPLAKASEEDAKPKSGSGDSKAEPMMEDLNLDDEPDEPYPELEEEGVIEPDPQDLDQVMGDPEASVSEEDMDKSNELRSAAVRAYNDGNFEEAVEKYTEAIKLNGGAAILLAKRGQAFLQLQRPNAAIKDCNRALQINPDSAIAYKFRGRAHRLLGHWEQAAADLRQACKIDFDEQADSWLKEVTPNARKVEEWKLKKKRREEERELKLRKLRAQERARAHAQAQSHGPASDEPGPGMPPGAENLFGGIPGMADMMNDPEVLEILEDPEVAAAFTDVGQNPMNILKYQNNPKVAKLLGIFKKKMGGGLGGMGGGFPGGMGGMPGGMGGMPGMGGFGGAGGGMPQFDPSAFAGATAPPRQPPSSDDLD